MLSRVAHSLYWMSRYLERAENTARLVDVNLQLLLDFKAGEDAPADYWRPIVDSTGAHDLFLALHPAPGGHSAVDFLVFDPRNPNSLVESVSRARENARTVRDQLTSELWEELNRLYLFVQSDDARRRFESSPSDFFEKVRNASLLLIGLGHATVMHGEGWQFVEVGRHLERGDQTTRILDVLHTAFPERGTPASWSERDSIEWAAVLRSCSAWDAYKSLYGATVEPTRVVGFLLLNEEFPRSVRFCAEEVDAALRRISGVADGRFANGAEQRSGRFLAELRFATVEDLLAEHGLHACLDLVQVRLAGIADGVAEAYVERVTREPAPSGTQHSQQQQQQQSAPA